LTWLDDLTLSSVIVHTKNNGPSFRGNVEAVYDDGILLRDLVNLDEDPHVVEAGTHLIVREDIQRVQRLEG
jgi:hypothetical protein